LKQVLSSHEEGKLLTGAIITLQTTAQPTPATPRWSRSPAGKRSLKAFFSTNPTQIVHAVLKRWRQDVDH
jgi:hypothetical protein